MELLMLSGMMNVNQRAFIVKTQSDWRVIKSYRVFFVNTCKK